MNKNIDVHVTEYDNGYLIHPISNDAKIVCKKYKGVSMKKYFIIKNSLQRHLEYYSATLARPIVVKTTTINITTSI